MSYLILAIIRNLCNELSLISILREPGNGKRETLKHHEVPKNQNRIIASNRNISMVITKKNTSDFLRFLFSGLLLIL